MRALRFTIMLTAASDAVEHNLLAVDECGPPLDLGDLSGVGFRVHLGTERRSIATPCSRQCFRAAGTLLLRHHARLDLCGSCSERFDNWLDRDPGTAYLIFRS